MTFTRTLDNPRWLADHAEELRSIFPRRWVCACTVNGNAQMIVSAMRRLGIRLRTVEDMGDLFSELVRVHILEYVPSQKGDIHQHGYFRVKPHGQDNDVEIVMTA